VVTRSVTGAVIGSLRSRAHRTRQIRHGQADDGNGRRRRSHEGLHARVVERGAIGEQAGQRGRDLRLAGLRGEVQDADVVDVGAIALRGDKGIVGLPEWQRRKQLLAVAIAGEGARLADQTGDDVAVVDAMIAAAQARHPLDRLSAIEDLDDGGMLADLDGVTDQAGGHRVGAAAEMNRAPAAHLTRVAGVAGNRGRRQGPQMGPLLGDAGRHLPIPGVVDDVAHEGRVGRLVDEVAGPAQQERLADRGLGPEVPLLDDAIFMRLADLDA
jgi:hypothetical protein